MKPMKRLFAAIVCVLFIIAGVLFYHMVFADGTSDIRITTWSYKIMPEDSLATVEAFSCGAVFGRSGCCDYETTFR
jgi:hypothetical protein